MAEIGLNVLFRQCLNRRIATMSWENTELENPPVINWLTTADALQATLPRTAT